MEYQNMGKYTCKFAIRYKVEKYFYNRVNSIIISVK